MYPSNSVHPSPVFSFPVSLSGADKVFLSTRAPKQTVKKLGDFFTLIQAAPLVKGPHGNDSVELLKKCAVIGISSFVDQLEENNNAPVRSFKELMYNLL
jgi:hypothetical protein